MSRTVHRELGSTKSLCRRSDGPRTVHHETEVVYLGLSNSRAREHREAARAQAGSSGLLMAPTTVVPVFLLQLIAADV